jgi:hypothetical protein
VHVAELGFWEKVAGEGSRAQRGEGAKSGETRPVCGGFGNFVVGHCFVPDLTTGDGKWPPDLTDASIGSGQWFHATTANLFFGL